jgi:hypothetical protein
MAWSRLHRSPVRSLEEYYVGYSAFVLSDVLSHPGFVWRVIAFNVTQYLHSLPGALGAPERLTVTALLVGIGLGLWRAWRHPILRNVMAMGWCYIVILMGFPYAFTRYLLPAFPIVYALVGCAGFSTEHTDGRWSASRLVGIVCACLLLAANVLELRHYATHSENGIHVGFGNYLPFGRDGFLQTAEWLRQHTPVDAKLVSANDTSYFTLTGRRGVRPFPYEPQYLQYGEAPQPTSVDVAGELRHLGIDYLVDDPYLLDLKPYVQTYVNGILQAPGDCWQLVFTSDDRLHRIYQRRSRASCGPSPVNGLTPTSP